MIRTFGNSAGRYRKEFLMSEKANEQKRGFLRSSKQVIKEFLFGMAVYETAMVPLKEKAELERLLFLTMFGDLLGIPIMRSYYTLQLLPYVCPRIEIWKRSTLRSRDWTDWAFD
jgi:hypothetical protein